MDDQTTQDMSGSLTPPIQGSSSETPVVEEVKEETPKVEGVQENPGSESVDKQRETTKTGFQLHPENINKNGRPPGLTISITELVKDALEKVGNDETGETYRELIIKKILSKAVDGDRHMVKLIWNYIDGMPLQKIEGALRGFGLPEEQIKEIDEFLAKNVKQPVPASNQ